MIRARGAPRAAHTAMRKVLKAAGTRFACDASLSTLSPNPMPMKKLLTADTTRYACAASLSTLSPAPTPPPSTMNFDDTNLAFGGRSTPDLLRAYAVFRLCTFGPLVRNAEAALSLSNSVLGSTVTDQVVKRTFFKHFCGGEATDDLRPCIKLLNDNGINGILDYAAENAPDQAAPCPGGAVNEPARTYSYEGEAECDRHVEVFKSCVSAVKDVTPHGFAALKLTALGNPALLERMSVAIVEASNLFAKFDKNGDGVVSAEEFEAAYREIFVDAETKLPELMPRILESGGNVDYIEWSKLLKPRDLPRFVEGCLDKNGPLSQAAPSPEELKLMERMRERLWEVAECARENRVRLLIDAEQTWFQPAIDNFVISLMKEFNDESKTDFPVVFNTYQAYLKDSADRVAVDLERADRNGFIFACKVVRGAYMVAESKRAEDEGREDPVWDSLQGTHDCYNGIVSKLIKRRMSGEGGYKGEVMVASHNRESVELAMSTMGGSKVPGVHFAQLLGMRDDLTFNLGNSGYNAYKYVPYGRVSEVIPYLIRRAQENSDITKGMGQEINLITKELKRRAFG